MAVLCERLLPVMGQGEYATAFDDRRRCAVLDGVIDGYYGDAPAEAVLFDTNRAWCAHLRVLAALRPEAFVIACVRDPVWILDSFELLFPSQRLPGLPACTACPTLPPCSTGWSS